MTEITVDFIGSNPLDKELARVMDPTPAYEAGVKFWRSIIAGEFAGQFWRPPSGSTRAWKEVKKFGNQPAPVRILSRSGRLEQAWAGGFGSITRITKDGAEFGVSGAALPYAAVHRGGAGAVTTAMAAEPERINVTPKMRVFLGLNKGVWLKKDTKVILIPRRPHATVNPEVRTGITAIMTNFVLRGAVREAA